MKLSARNIIKGKITEVVKGATTAHVKLDVGSGTVITASITVEAVDELKLRRATPPTRSSRHRTSWSARTEAAEC